ncbi:hypothetical protein BB561_005013 [Smittium simulii]|uniref:SART-1 protein n=1 Tax=Smittium simulii TaxID=133385 RepID=A0A2T9YCU3_9FUNG|nr:hypothetical protein BB561_005013 [Smittium simulii]
MADEISLSIEETNKLRISLGLKPLDSGKSVSEEQAARDNFNKYQEQEKAKLRKDELKKRIERSKNKRESVQIIQGKGIADDAGDIDDALSWVTKSRKKQKISSLAKKQQAKIDEQENQYMESQYTSNNLKGLEVAHRLDDIKEGEEEILVLKDQTIAELEESGDMLQSNQLLEQKTREKNIRIQKHVKNVGTFGKDHDDLVSGISYLDNSYLNNEDDQNSKFRLGENGLVTVNAQNSTENNGQSNNSVNSTLSLGMNTEIPKQADDYFTAQEASLLFKKKKKKQKSLPKNFDSNLDKIIEIPNDCENSNGNIDNTSIKHIKKKTKSRNTAESKKRDYKTFESWEENMQVKNEKHQKDQFRTFFEKSSTQSFVDDDDLQIAVALTRKKKLEYKLPTVLETKEHENTNTNIQDDYGEAAIVLSTITEFAQKVGNTTDDWMNPFEKNKNDFTKSKVSSTKLDNVAENDDNIISEYSNNDAYENDFNSHSYNESNNGPPIDNTELQSRDLDSIDNDISEKSNKDTDEEPLVRSGIGSALKLLLKKGLISKPDEELIKIDKEKQVRQQWLIDSKKRELLKNQEIEKIKKQRRLDNTNNTKSSKKSKVVSKSGQSTHPGDKRSEAMEQELQRLQDSERLEKDYLKKHEESMTDYKPTFTLKYTDDSGRELNQKEAFKHFAHQFHGIYPGKKKTDKLNEKIKRETQLQAAATSEQTLKMGETWNNNMKKQNNPYVLLTTGNKAGLDSVKLNKN